VYFSFDSGKSWIQPAYPRGWTAADCTPQTVCKGHEGPIHTLPWYYENQLVSFGDPAVAIGPKRGSDGRFSWSAGERVYYANLTATFSTQNEFSFPNKVFKGYTAVAVSRLDDPTPASILQKSSWKQPAIVTQKQGSTAFQDKEQIWADNAASSRFFGRVYVCSVEFRSNGVHGPGTTPQPVDVSYSTDGGDSWTTKQATAASASGNGKTEWGMSGCTIRTDSHGVVYLFTEQFQRPDLSGLPTHGAHVMLKSFDGGAHWTKPRILFRITDPCYFVDPVYGRCVMDGYSGARTDLAGSPSVDVANGAPLGNTPGHPATNEIVDAWVGAPALNGERAVLAWSIDGGTSWSPFSAASLPGDRPMYTAPAISPNGERLYVVYEAVTSPWRGDDFTSPRPYHGVLRTATIGANGAPAGWATAYDEAPGDLRATYPGHDLYQERVGDYVYAAASNSYGMGVWTSARDAALCQPVQSYRARSFAAGQRDLPGAPWPLRDCPPSFGNTDIRAATTAP
jgi:hypothetical protein